MAHKPTADLFASLAANHTVVPVYRELTADALTPVAAFQALDAGDWSFLFESVIGGERVGRYSFLGAGPVLTLEARGKTVTVASTDGTTETRESTDPLRDLEDVLKKWNPATVPGLPRFCGGAVGYAGYDTVRYVEHLPNAPEDDRHLPDLSFAIYERMVIFDHITKTVKVVAHAHVGPGCNVKAEYDRAKKHVDEVVALLSQPVTGLAPADVDLATAKLPASRIQSNFTQSEYENAVVQAKEFIAAGDIFQVVLSQRFQTNTTAKPFDIYRALRVVNPSPFMFFVRNGKGLTLIGASPEIMCRVDGRETVSRPLAGTRKRGVTPEEDKALAAELQADPKERAEHIMLVDLARNDVGRVSEIGSVKLSDLLNVERYSHVMHLSSTVTGTLRKELSAFDALRASLPAGTLSGAPKVRAMEIIDELEPHRRGPYGGAVGYVDFSGNMDTCIALRTMVLQGSTAYVQAGAGVVADSEPTAEYQETVNKAMGLMTALAVAEQWS